MPGAWLEVEHRISNRAGGRAAFRPDLEVYVGVAFLRGVTGLVHVSDDITLSDPGARFGCALRRQVGALSAKAAAMIDHDLTPIALR